MLGPRIFDEVENRRGKNPILLTTRVYPCLIHFGALKEVIASKDQDREGEERVSIEDFLFRENVVKGRLCSVTKPYRALKISHNGNLTKVFSVST